MPSYTYDQHPRVVPEKDGRLVRYCLIIPQLDLQYEDKL